jgi:biotin carboxylase
MSKTFICISNYFKGNDFLKELKALNNKVFLITSEKIKDENWAFDAIDDLFLMPGQDIDWNLDHLLLGVAGIMKNHKIDAVIALDDYDVEKGAYLRENLRIDGMGLTTSRYFRDKLAMRIKAKEEGIPIPPFTALFNDDDVNYFADNIAAPWLLKPRSEASANGILKVHNKEDLWKNINELGDNRTKYLVEQFKPGAVYHCDGLNFNNKVQFSITSQYLATPMEISQGGGIFRSANVPYDSDDDIQIKAVNDKVMQAFGMKFGASHTEFIKCNEDGKIYFLETASRVGGAHLAEMVDAASGINLWKEWAVIEDAMANQKKYKCPKPKKEFAGIVLTLSKFENPDLSSFSDPEVCFTVPLAYHAGLIVKSKSQAKIRSLLEQYAEKLINDFATSATQEKLEKFH